MSEETKQAGGALAGVDSAGLLAELKSCAFCAGTNPYWSEVVPGGFVHSCQPSGHYHFLVCRDCGAAMTPCPKDQSVNCAAHWNVRLASRGHSSEYFAAVRAEEVRLKSLTR